MAGTGGKYLQYTDTVTAWSGEDHHAPGLYPIVVRGDAAASGTESGSGGRAKRTGSQFSGNASE